MSRGEQLMVTIALADDVVSLRINDQIWEFSNASEYIEFWPSQILAEV